MTETVITAAGVLANPALYLGRDLKNKGTLVSVKPDGKGGWFTYKTAQGVTGSLFYTNGRRVTFVN